MAIQNPQAIASGVKGALSAAQAIKASTIDDKRPKKRTPESVKQATDLTRRLSLITKQPGSTRAENRIQQSAADAVSRAQESSNSAGDVLNTVGGIQGNTNEAMRNLSAQEGQYMARQDQNYVNQLNREGRYEESNWQYNQAQRYDEQARTKSALTQSSLANLDSAVSNYATYDFARQLYGFDNEANADTGPNPNSNNTNRAGNNVQPVKRQGYKKMGKKGPKFTTAQQTGVGVQDNIDKLARTQKRINALNMFNNYRGN